MLRQAARLEGRLDPVERPTDQGIDLHLAVHGLDRRQIPAHLTLVAFAPGNPSVEAFERAPQRQHLAEMATGIGAVPPERPVRVLGEQRRPVGRDGADILEAQFAGELVAVVEGFLEVLAGIEEDHRHRRVDLRHQRQEHGGLGAEGGDDGDAAGKDAPDHRLQ
jgi:hypothetical protein